MFYVDLNSDLGESFGNYTIGMDEEILQYVSSANVACGWHAGDPMVMDKTIALAKKYGTAVGAHPGFPDLMPFPYSVLPGYQNFHWIKGLCSRI